MNGLRYEWSKMSSFLSFLIFHFNHISQPQLDGALCSKIVNFLDSDLAAIPWRFCQTKEYISSCRYPGCNFFHLATW